MVEFKSKHFLDLIWPLRVSYLVKKRKVTTCVGGWGSSPSKFDLIFIYFYQEVKLVEKSFLSPTVN